MTEADTIIFRVEDAEEGGFNARAIDHCIFTEAGTWQELKKNIREAVACHFDEGLGPQTIRVLDKDQPAVTME